MNHSVRTAAQEAAHKQMQRDETRKLKDALQGRWDQVLPALIPEIALAVDKGHQHHITCPFHGGANDFRVYADFADTGGAICSCGTWPDGWKLLMHAKNCTFWEAKKMLVEALGGRFDAANLPPRYVESKDPDAIARKDSFNKKVVQETWQESLPLSAEDAFPVRRWFFNRQLGEVRGPLTCIRFHPALQYFEPSSSKSAGRRQVLHTGPAMVAMLTDIAGRTCGLHRTWLTDDGHKAAVDAPRRLTSAISTHPINGAAVKLDAAAGPVLSVGEGIESSLAARAIAKFHTWSTINKTLMAQLHIPDEVQFVIVWADRDTSGAGQSAGGELVQRVRNMGKKAVLVLPPFSVPEGGKSVDWNDVVAALGLDNAINLPEVQQVLQPLYAAIGQIH
ncbi:toprim domain-containing protein (plasmid) [Xanthomonas citri pv. citri]|uniref:DUF7146 domain-containing protein n=1 Tax=Xanthomonas citri TaxID=346 RepID=UPI00193382B0|nr:toprim domain-containing protein [Xanthomonas citri]QRD62756.1 toprim domain-containing protein [Xanthomonas citri pv. citri]QRD67083.1 toprim domain-containing protein [Xanthomonas citri pv. citri]QRD71664.1 toprim domain-containing protein [Xanthomonas citri pv. citri]